MATQPVQIIGAYLSPYVRKVLVCLELKGVAYEIDPLTPFMGDDRFSELSPVRRVPVSDRRRGRARGLVGDLPIPRRPVSNAGAISGRHFRSRPSALVRGVRRYEDGRSLHLAFVQPADHPAFRLGRGDGSGRRRARKRTKRFPAFSITSRRRSLPRAVCSANFPSRISRLRRSSETRRTRVTPLMRAAGRESRLMSNGSSPIEPFAKLKKFEDLSSRTPIDKQRTVLKEAGAPISAKTYATAQPRRGVLQI